MPRLPPSETAPLGESGGPDQVRTDDLLNAIEALFQLSYEPMNKFRRVESQFFRPEGKEFFGSLKAKLLPAIILGLEALRRAGDHRGDPGLREAAFPRAPGA